MGEFSIWHWLVVLLVVLLLFGGGKLSGLMGDLAKGIRAFKANITDDPQPSQASGSAAAEARGEQLANPVERGATARAAPATEREQTAVH